MGAVPCHPASQVARHDLPRDRWPDLSQNPPRRAAEPASAYPRRQKVLPRTTSLSYAEDGDSYLVVASKGGGPRPRGLDFNLKASPNVEINIGPNRMPTTARIIGEDQPDYKRLWKLVNDNSANRYDGYQTRITRTVPIIALTPR